MGLSSYFNATIRYSGIKEFSLCIDRLLGRHLFLQDKSGDLHDPSNIYFCDEPEKCSIKSRDNLPYDRYHMIDPLSPDIDFYITISKDKTEKNGYADGDKIEIFDFIDKSYDSEKDFVLLRKTCEIMGFCSYSISDEWTGKNYEESFKDVSKVYICEIRNAYLSNLERDITKILLDVKIVQVFSSDIKEINDIYDKMMEERQKNSDNNPFKDKDYTFLAERTIVKGFVLSGLSEDEFIKQMNRPYENYKPEYISNIIKEYIEKKESYEKEDTENDYE